MVLITPSEKFVLPCIVCGKVCKSLDTVNQPYAGTAFHTHGHYGSTVFDPMMDPLDLEITVCDDCLKEATKNKKVLIRKTTEHIEYQYALAEVQGEHEVIGSSELQ